MSLHIVASAGHSIEYYDARNNKYKINTTMFGVQIPLYANKFWLQQEVKYSAENVKRRAGCSRGILFSI